MSPLDEAELQARLAAVRDGPWAKRATAAHSPFEIRPASEVLGQLASDVFPKPKLSGPLVSSGSPITFRIWGTQGAPLTAAQLQARARFDDAYTYFQLVDLAIDTGYLPANQIDVPVRAQLSEISKPLENIRIGNDEFQPYLSTGFETARFLTERSEPTHPDGAVHFASFLATDRSLSRNPLCVAWQSFLEDKPDEQPRFYEFLKSKERATSVRQQTLILGAQSFVVLLSDFLIALPESLQTRFAYLYGNSLRHFFGHRTDRSGLNLALKPWTYIPESWAVVVGDWINERGSAGASTYSSLAVASLYNESLGVLRPIWERVHKQSVEQAALADRFVQI
jgi:hypothetical protein